MLLLQKVVSTDPDSLKSYDSFFLAGVSYSMILHLSVICQQTTTTYCRVSLGVVPKPSSCPELHTLIPATVIRCQYQPALLCECTTFL